MIIECPHCHKMNTHEKWEAVTELYNDGSLNYSFARWEQCGHITMDFRCPICRRVADLHKKIFKEQDTKYFFVKYKRS